MLYPYKCDACGLEHDVWKYAAQASDPETCPTCDTILTRIYTVPLVSVRADAFFNHGLGCMDKGPDTLKAINSERRDKGQPELIPLGNESVKPKPKKDPYAMNRDEMAKIDAILEK